MQLGVAKKMVSAFSCQMPVWKDTSEIVLQSIFQIVFRKFLATAANFLNPEPWTISVFLSAKPMCDVPVSSLLRKLLQLSLVFPSFSYLKILSELPPNNTFRCLRWHNVCLTFHWYLHSENKKQKYSCCFYQSLQLLYNLTIINWIFFLNRNNVKYLLPS